MATHADPPREKKRRRKMRSGYTFEGWTKAINAPPIKMYPIVETYVIGGQGEGGTGLVDILSLRVPQTATMTIERSS
jgi:hypothetical protein